MASYNHTIPAWKIRRRSDGLFSTGGRWPRFNEKGKIWYHRGGMTSHVNCVVFDSFSNEQYFDCEVVEYEVLHNAVGKMTVAEYVEDRISAKEKREEEKEARLEAGRKESRRKQWLELKDEFE